jgi:hypothetical protein
MEDARQLVFLGHHNEADWAERGHAGVKDPFPIVVLAIKPVLGSLSHGFLRSGPGEGPLHPIWCQCLFPPREIGDYERGFRPKLRPPTYGSLGRTVNLNLVWLGDRQAGLSWDIDASGHKVPDSLVVNDVYKGIEPPLPNPDVFQLGDLPPITSQPVKE